MTITSSSQAEVHTTPMRPTLDHSRQDSQRSAPVLLATMALTLMLAVAFIALTALEAPVGLSQASALLVGTTA